MGSARYQMKLTAFIHLGGPFGIGTGHNKVGRSVNNQHIALIRLDVFVYIIVQKGRDVRTLRFRRHQLRIFLNRVGNVERRVK